MNKAILTGNLGKDPELKKLPSGSSVAEFSLATSETYVDKTGSKQTVTEWHNVVFFGSRADVVAKYLSKGSKILVEGQINYQSWEDAGVKKYKTVIKGLSFEFLDSKKESSSMGEPKMASDLPF